MVDEKENKQELNLENKEEKELELVTKEMLIGEVVQKHREAAFVMMQYGLHCIGCAVSAFESVEEGCLAHGMDEETVDKIIDEINKLIREESNDKKIEKS